MPELVIRHWRFDSLTTLGQRDGTGNLNAER